jgi:hypothetical protein
MAIVRCESCGKPTQNVKAPGYGDAPHMPAGHPNSGLVCGKPGCENPGLVWLKQDEEKEYSAGDRIFLIPTHAAKVRIQ